MFEIIVAMAVMNANPTGMELAALHATVAAPEASVLRDIQDTALLPVGGKVTIEWLAAVDPASESANVQNPDNRASVGENRAQNVANGSAPSFDHLSHNVFLSKRWRWFEAHENARLGSTGLVPFTWSPFEH